MDAGRQDGKQLQHDAASLMRAWGAEGWELADPVVAEYLAYQSAPREDFPRNVRPGSRLETVIDPYVLALMVYKGPGKADIAKGLRAIEDGRRRWGYKAA